MFSLGLRPLARAVTLLGIASSAALGLPACYPSTEGSPPPEKLLYFPVGLAVSRGGNVLYAANSDFDLQYNGGTLQSYDLRLVRRHVVRAIVDPTDPNLPLVRYSQAQENPCPDNPPIKREDGTGIRQTLGETCSPPVDSTFYVRDSAVIGAFSTDLQLANVTRNRLFVPVRGDASLTWADVVPDDPNVPPPEKATDPYPPFTIDCGVRSEGRCDAAHHAGNDPNEPGNTRHLTMPGEPFGLAQSEDGTALVITHQNDTKTSLFASGLAANLPPVRPALQFVLAGLPFGGVGVVAIPHDPQAFVPCAGPTPGGLPCPTREPRPAFLQTSRAVAELQLLRFYSDEGAAGVDASSLKRPFLIRELAFPITANAGGTDSRGVLIDPTPRIACKLKAVTPAEKVACAQKPARLFVANRSPASLLVGEIGRKSASGDGTYDPDRVSIHGNVPLTFGPSKLFLAPIVDAAGELALRLFIVCFDSATIFVYDPDAGAIENIIRVASGPFAMAFDPFDLEDVAAHKKVEVQEPSADPRLQIKRYRFAYVASFTNSFIQVIDLDAGQPGTYERIVFSLGRPTLPKGSR
jgi:hypothetical protein